jgi:hypothetical protein
MQVSAQAIETRVSEAPDIELEKWFKAEAYEDSTKSPVEFVNKVRTPCGQFTEKDKCNGSNLCGWKTEKGKGVCKVRVKPVVDKTRGAPSGSQRPSARTTNSVRWFSMSGCRLSSQLILYT